MDRDKHRSEEVTAAVKSLNEKSPEEFVTVETMDEMVDMCTAGGDGSSKEDEDDHNRYSGWKKVKRTAKHLSAL